MKRLPAICCVALLGLSHPVSPELTPIRLKLAIVQVPTEARIKRLRWISSESAPKDKDVQKALIAVRLRQIQETTQATLVETLEQKPFCIVLKDPATTGWTDSLNLANNDAPIPVSALSRFREETQADAVLRFKITDYGRTPRKVMKWIYAGTGAWIVGAITLATLNSETRPYIGAYIGSEVLQEGAELYLGTSLFGAEYKPVRIEAELIDTRTGRVLWEDTKTKTASSGIMKNFPKEERKRKELQLAVSTERAISALVDSLSLKLRQQPSDLF